MNLEEHFPDPETSIKQAREAGVETLILVGIDTATSERALELATAHESVFAIVGWHPNYAAAYSEQALKQLEQQARHPKAVAIGEIGLDFHWDYATPQQQERCLLDQLALARDLDMPVVFHCREAYPELLSILETLPPHPYLFHCFSGNSADAGRAMTFDSYFGIDGPITYKKSANLRELVRLLPKDRIVLETDSPYLSPEPVRGKPNTPANLRFINNAVAAAMGKTAEETADLTTENARRFFRL